MLFQVPRDRMILLDFDYPNNSNMSGGYHFQYETCCKRKNEPIGQLVSWFPKTTIDDR